MLSRVCSKDWKVEQMNKHIHEMGKWYALVVFGVTLFVGLQHINVVIDVLEKVIDVFSPFLYGLGIAYVIDVMVRWMTGKWLKNHRGIAILLSYIIFIQIIQLMLCAIIPQSIQSIVSLINNVDYYKELANNAVVNINDKLGTDLSISGIIGNQTSQNDEMVSNLLTQYSQKLVNTVGQIAQTSVKILTAFAASIYIVLDKYKLEEQCYKMMNTFLSRRTVEFICRVAKMFDSQTTSFFIGKILDSIIIGILTFIAMQVLQLPYSVLIQTIVGVTNIIPVFGPFIGAIPGILILLINNPIQALQFGVLIIIIQQLDGNFIGPKILGQTSNVQAFWILFQIVIGGNCAGVLGMILGVPVFIVVQTLLKEYQQQRFEQSSIVEKK